MSAPTRCQCCGGPILNPADGKHVCEKCEAGQVGESEPIFIALLFLGWFALLPLLLLIAFPRIFI
jgi:hypothetical protein